MRNRYSIMAVLAVCLLGSTTFAQNAKGPENGKVANNQSQKRVAVTYVPEAEVRAGTPTNPARPGAPFMSKAGRNFGANILVNAPQQPMPLGRLGRSETTIATDPSGKFLVAGWNDAQGFCGAPFGAPCVAPPVPGLSGYGWSTNGGDTWTDGGTPPTLNDGDLTWMTRGDPWWDNGGEDGKTFYMSNMAVPVVDPTVDGLTGVIVHRGKFSSHNFTFNKTTLIPPTNSGLDSYDKSSIAAGKSDYTQNRVSLAATNFIAVFGIPFYGYGQIETYTSDNQGVTFPKRGIVQVDETDMNDGSGVINQGADVVLGTRNNVYVTWERGWLAPVYFGAPVWPQIVFAKSTDGGATYGARVLVSDISSGSYHPPVGYNRPTSNDFPRIAYDPNFQNRNDGDDDHGNNGNRKGRLYITYHDSRIANGGTQAVVNNEGNGNTDVYVRYSSDDGATWSAPKLVAGGPTTQFFPAVSVQPDGTVDVVWYQNDEGITDVYYAASTNGGTTFSPPIRVTSASTDWTTVVAQIRPNFGDYLGIASRENRAFACWGDGRPDNVVGVFAAPIAYGTPKDAQPEVALPGSVTLEQNYPNPFNPSTSLGFSIPVESAVSLRVYNTMGQLVETLVDGVLPAGSHHATFHAEQLAGGAYLYKLTAGDVVATRIMMLVK